MDDSHFDVIILGTGLTESITAAALSKVGYKVAHIDTNPYYGSEDASLSLDELIAWADKHALNPISSDQIKYTSVSHSGTQLPFARQYSISLMPALIYSMGPLISSLVSSGVARYGGYRLLQRISIFREAGRLASVPGSKEDVFKDKEISLIDKRRLMRFLMFAAGEFEDKPELSGREDMPFHEFLQAAFSLNNEAQAIITYTLAYCITPSDSSKPALERVRRFLRSAGRYGPSSFLVGHYGGAGEIAQGFCRTAAVSGAVYILGRTIISLSPPSSADEVAPPEPPKSTAAFTVTLDDFPEPLTCDLVISSRKHLPESLSVQASYIPPHNVPHPNISVARCVAIIDRALTFSTSTQPSFVDGEESASPRPDDESPDAAMIVFPPSSVEGGSNSASATAILMGEGTMSTPAGKWILYLSLPLVGGQFTSDQSAESTLRPYLSAALSFGIDAEANPLQPLFTLFYYERHSSITPTSSPNASPESASDKNVLVTPPSDPLASEFFDAAATNAEATYRAASSFLKQRRPETASDEVAETDSFWPPVEQDAEDEDEWE
ncbi:hypothetical protein HGRIS_009203 [Hohenbuehelia grisea]|uniref:Rab proteins geranylgeranyltransferase component A n=1 Tax=Hohenbuehelia grisea TaxID=104357 RepID=A0ABR3J0N4_9AGAR